MAKRGPKAGQTTTGAAIIKLLRKGKLKPHQIAAVCGVTRTAVMYYKRMLASGGVK